MLGGAAAEEDANMDFGLRLPESRRSREAGIADFGFVPILSGWDLGFSIHLS